MVIVVVFLQFGFSGRSQSLIAPGWEIYDQVGAIEQNDTVYSRAEQFTSPRELKGVFWKVDVDDPNSGIATTEVEVGDIHHVDFAGHDIPNDHPADTLTVARGNKTYYLDYHIYLYTVTIRTIADKVQYVFSPWVPQYKHETSFPYEGWNGPFGGVGTTYVGKKFQGGAYTKFVISPWNGGSYRSAPNSSYILDNCWAGVMNTYVLYRSLGQVTNQWGEMPNPDPQGNTFVGAGLDQGNQVPMFADDGTFGTPAPITNWDPNVTPDTRISSTVVHYLPVDMLAGAKLTADMWGIMQNLSPCDVYVQYTLRVDVLQVHGFILKTAHNPPNPKTPTDFFSWVLSFWEGVWKGLTDWANSPLTQIWAVFIVLVVAVAIIMIASRWGAAVLGRRK